MTLQINLTGRDENDHVHPRTVQNTKIFTWTRRKATSSEKKNVVTTERTCFVVSCEKKNHC